MSGGNNNFFFNGTAPNGQPWTFEKAPMNTWGIPNFFSKPVFGMTDDIIRAAQFLMCAAVVLTILRIFARRRSKSKFLWDDLCALCATGLLISNTIIFIEFNYLGRISFSFFVAFTDEAEQQRRRNIVVGLKLSLAFEVLYLLGISLVRFSMLFLYDRFARQARGISLYLRITQAVCAVSLSVCILSLFLSCKPISNFWNLDQPDPQCSKRTLLTYTSGISNIVTNTLVLAVPVPLLLRATLSRQQKIGVCILYLFGAAVILASALRFVTQLLNVSLPQAMGWSQIEISLALLLASAPMAVKLLCTPLLDVQSERTRIRDKKKICMLQPSTSPRNDSPIFMKKLLKERDAMYTPRSMEQAVLAEEGRVTRGWERLRDM